MYFFPSGKYTERWRWERKSEQPNHSLPTADIVLYSFRVKLSSLNVCLTYIQVCKDVKKKNINTSVKAQLCYPLGESCLVHFKHQEIMLTTWFKATDSEVNWECEYLPANVYKHILNTGHYYLGIQCFIYKLFPSISQSWLAQFAYLHSGNQYTRRQQLDHSNPAGNWISELLWVLYPFRFINFYW